MLDNLYVGMHQQCSECLRDRNLNAHTHTHTYDSDKFMACFAYDTWFLLLIFFISSLDILGLPFSRSAPFRWSNETVTQIYTEIYTEHFHWRVRIFYRRPIRRLTMNSVWELKLFIFFSFQICILTICK